MDKQERLLFIYTNLSTFVKGDLEALRPHYRITTYRFDLNTNKGLVMSFIKQFFWLVVHIWRFRKVYIWFGDYHSFLPVLWARMTGKSSYLVVGGYDVCRIRSLKYGSFKNPVRGFMTRFSMRHCTLNLCVSRYVERKVKAIAPKAKTLLIYNGTNLTASDKAATVKKNQVLTVGSIQSEQTYYRKGIDRYLEVACQLPEYEFVVVGISPRLAHLHPTIPPNVRVFDKIPQEELVSYYQSAKVYCQLSRMDTFCMTIAEGMLYNCIPVITHVGGMPEVTGDLGYTVLENRTGEIVQAIRQAMSLPATPRYAERIKNLFTLQRRQEELVRALKEYV